MPRTARLARPGGNYAGITLAEWRGTVRALLSSGWWVFGESHRERQSSSSLHYAVIQASTLLLPLAWHTANASRFSKHWYDQRRGAVNARAYFLHPPREEGRHET